MSEQSLSATREVDWGKVIETALDMLGDLGNVYIRFFNYSYANQAYLWMQGAREPVASMRRWNTLDRRVLAGSRAFEIIAPIFAKKDKDGPEAEPVIIGFRGLRRIFTYSQTEGEELPPVEIPAWDTELMLATLGISRVPFRRNDTNVQGYARGREIAINPFAVHPEKSLFHETGHVVLGHTTPEMITEYEQHRGLFEFGAEATAHLVLKELGRLTVEMATHSRGYIQDWLKGERPPDNAIRQVFAPTDQILKAGRLASVRQ